MIDRCIKHIFDLQYFQLTVGLSGHNPVVSQGRSWLFIFCILVHWGRGGRNRGREAKTWHHQDLHNSLLTSPGWPPCPPLWQVYKSWFNNGVQLWVNTDIWNYQFPGRLTLPWVDFLQTYPPYFLPIVGPHSRQLFWAESHQGCSRMSHFMASHDLMAHGKFSFSDVMSASNPLRLPLFALWSLSLSQEPSSVFLSCLNMLGYILHSDGRDWTQQTSK